MKIRTPLFVAALLAVPWIAPAQEAGPIRVEFDQGDLIAADNVLSISFAAQLGEKQTYLGVSATPVPDALRAHLDLPAGFGLIVEHVVPDSPAAKAGIETHDVLHKLGDQVLVNIEQLTTLVRSHKPGDKVQLTLIRKSKPLTLDVELAEQQVQAELTDASYGLPILHFRAAQPRATVQPYDLRDLTIPNFKVRVQQEGGVQDHVKALEEHLKALEGRTDPVPADEIRKQLYDVIQKIKEHHEKLLNTPHGRGGASGELQLVVSPTASGALYELEVSALDSAAVGTQATQAIVAKYDDGVHVVTLTNTNGDKHLTATDKAGNTLFDGPINTPEELEMVPAEVREKLDKLSAQTKIEVGGAAR